MKTDYQLIKSISCAFKHYFENGLKFILKDGAYVVEGTHSTINRFDNPIEKVKAKKWFDDMWIFIKIKFVRGDNTKEKYFPTISISFFLETSENCLDQLFRAEWDCYENVSTSQHPQPHWHITSALAVEKSLEDLVSDNVEVDDPFKVFADLVEEEKKNLLKLHTMHFAMTGQWHENGNFINEIHESHVIINWMKYLFSHVRNEIEYMKKEFN